MSLSKITTELLLDAAALKSEGVEMPVNDVGACVGTAVGFADFVGAIIGLGVGTSVGFTDVGAGEGGPDAVKLSPPK